LEGEKNGEAPRPKNQLKCLQAKEVNRAGKKYRGGQACKESPNIGRRKSKKEIEGKVRGNYRLASANSRSKAKTIYQITN